MIVATVLRYGPERLQLDFYNKSITFYMELMHAFCIKHVIGLTPASGIFAEAAMCLKKQYFGVLLWYRSCFGVGEEGATRGVGFCLFTNYFLAVQSQGLQFFVVDNINKLLGGILIGFQGGGCVHDFCINPQRSAAGDAAQ